MSTILAYKEAAFPVDYREAEVGQIMAALYRLRSIAITGMAGMGKSNVVRFSVSHPEVRARYLKERADDYAFVHVDCAGLARDEEEILAEIAAQLYRAGLTPGESPRHQSPREARRMLKERILGVDASLSLVVALDYFDKAAVELDASFFDYLFHLRNARPRGNLAYVFVTRRPLGRLGELQELLDEGCVIGPLGCRDALDSIRRDEARLGCVFEATQRDKLIACTGGHPGFMKNASELLASGVLDAGLSEGEMACQMLQAGRVRALCEELWRDLTPPEQAILARATNDLPLPHVADVATLGKNGLLVRKNGEPAIFSPLFEAFVCEQSPDPGAVRIEAVFPNLARIKAAAGEESVTLSPKLFALLAALAGARGRVLSTDALIASIYGDEADGVTNAALSQLVKRLRAALDPCLHKMLGDPTYTCVETVRDAGYRFNG